MLKILIAVFLLSFSSAVLAEYPQPWGVVIDTLQFQNATPEEQRKIRQQWEKDYIEEEKANKVMVDLWDKHPELHTDTNEYFGFIARRDGYLQQGKPLSEALKLAASDTFPQKIAPLKSTLQKQPFQPQQVNAQNPGNFFDKYDEPPTNQSTSTAYLTEKEVFGTHQYSKKTTSNFSVFRGIVIVAIIFVIDILILITPHLIIRYSLVKRPLSRKESIFAAFCIWVVCYFLVFVFLQDTMSKYKITGVGNIITCAAVVGYFILSRNRKGPSEGIPNIHPPTAKAIRQTKIGGLG